MNNNNNFVNSLIFHFYTQRRRNMGERNKVWNISIIIITLKSFPKKWLKYYREISSLLYSTTSCFLVSLPNFPLSFPQHILSNVVYPSGLRSSFWSFSLRFCVWHFLRYSLFFCLCHMSKPS